MAALRLLLRRRLSASPSLAVLHPLLPGPFSKPPTPFLAAAAGLLDVRRAQLLPDPAPSLLRLYSSKSKVCSAPPQKQTRNRGETARVNQGEKCRSTVADTEIQYDTVEYLHRILEDIMKLSQELAKARETFEKACHLLAEGCDDKAFVVVENALDNVWNALDVYEKGLQKLAKACESCTGLSPDFRQKQLVSIQAMLDGTQNLRQDLEKYSSSLETLKTRKKLRSLAGNLYSLKRLTNWDLSSSAENKNTLWRLNKGIITVGLGSCLLLAMLMIGMA